MKRVVVTGMGIVSSIGNSAQEVLASLREAKSGIVKADKYAELGFRCQVHGAPKLDGGGKGDLIARLRLTVPKKLSKKEREALEELQKLSHDDPREALFS